MKNFKKWALFGGLGATLIAGSAVAVSCGTTTETDTTFANNVVIQTAQSEVYPLMIALNKLIPIYNEQQKDADGFMEVILQDSSVTKATGELNLASTVASNIQSNSQKIPALILGNQASAYQINSYERLMDVSSVVPYSLFNEKVAKNHSVLVGQSDNRLYNIPFDVTDVDSLGFNLDIMYKLFTLIKKGGGTVDESMTLYTQAKTASENGTSIPDESQFSIIELKGENSFARYEVNAETFASIDKVLDFAQKVYDGTQIPTDKITAKMLDAQIFTIDYQADTLYKQLNNALEGKFLWTLSTNAAGTDGNKSYINYDAFKDDTVKKTFIDTWNTFVGVNSQSNHDVTADSNTDTKTFYSVKYANNSTEWASWDIRTYRTAFSFVAAVGIEQASQSPTAKRFFGSATSYPYASSAQYSDILYEPQITVSNYETYPSYLSSTYLEGGSSLIPITNTGTNSDAVNKGTKAFLKWLYTGEVIGETEEPISVTEYIARNSGYVVPTKENVSQKRLTSLKARFNELQTSIDGLTEKSKTETLNTSEQATLDSNTTERNYTRTAIVTLESLLKYVESTSDKDHGLLYPLDDKSASLSTTINTALFNHTGEKDNKVTKTGQELWDELLAIVTLTFPKY